MRTRLFFFQTRKWPKFVLRANCTEAHLDLPRLAGAVAAGSAAAVAELAAPGWRCGCGHGTALLTLGCGRGWLGLCRQASAAAVAELAAPGWRCGCGRGTALLTLGCGRGWLGLWRQASAAAACLAAPGWRCGCGRGTALLTLGCGRGPRFLRIVGRATAALARSCGRAAADPAVTRPRET